MVFGNNALNPRHKNFIIHLQKGNFFMLYPIQTLEKKKIQFKIYKTQSKISHHEDQSTTFISHLIHHGDVNKIMLVLEMDIFFKEYKNLV